MTTRTFKQLGQAYGSTPAEIVAIVNGTVVFSGAVPTTDTPLPVLPDESVSGTQLFTWTNTVDFSGTQSFSISVTNSPLLLTDTLADYVISNVTSKFGGFYHHNIDGVTIGDPITNAAIDGIPMQRGPDSTNLTGQWYWTIPAGSTFTATLNVDAGVEPPLV
jgi:hypothetical protein